MPRLPKEVHLLNMYRKSQQKICCNRNRRRFSHVLKPFNASYSACKAFDLIERATQKEIIHVHYEDFVYMHGKEFKIPGSNYRPDGWTMENGELVPEVWEYFGNKWHGFPPETQQYQECEINQALYHKTMDRLCKIQDLSPDLNIKFVWEHELNEKGLIINFFHR